jgi:predicted ATPase
VPPPVAAVALDTAPVRRCPFFPSDLVPLFGRTAERALLATLFRQRQDRCVTLLGTGGIGKTRLAREVARDLCDHFDGLVWFVSLSAIRHPGELFFALLHSLKESGFLAVSGQETAARAGGNGNEDGVRSDVLSLLRSVPGALVVMDNLEQVVDDGVGLLLTDLLESVPGLQLLCTSRQVVGVPGEVRMELGPMDGENARALFLHHVRAVSPTAVITAPTGQLAAHETASVAAICSRLDGIPLALELAASWASTLTLGEIRARLSLPLLARQTPTSNPYHQTLAGCIEASFDLLAPALRWVWLALSVFRGGCTVEAAAAVVGEDGSLAALGALQNRSLLIAVRGDDGTRFGMLETLREYAAHRAADGTSPEMPPDEWNRVRARHFRWCRDVLAGIAGDTTRGDEDAARAAYARAEAEEFNLRAAIEYGIIGTLEEYGDALDMVRRAVPVWAHRGRKREVTAQFLGWSRRLAARVHECTGDLRASALRCAAYVQWMDGDHGGAAAYREAAALHAEHGNPVGEGKALVCIGRIHAEIGDTDAATEAHLFAAEAFGRAGDGDTRNHLRVELAEIYHIHGENTRAARLLDECLQYITVLPSPSSARRGGQDRSATYALICLILAGVRHQEKRFADAETLARRALGIYEGRGDLLQAARARYLIGIALADQDKGGEEAEAALRAALDFFEPHVRAGAHTEGGGVTLWDRTSFILTDLQKRLAVSGAAVPAHSGAS